jgi:hypothetical protein
VKTYAVLLILLLGILSRAFAAEIIEMKNGDHYSGRVLSMTSDKLVFQSEMLGRITLTRSNISSITLSPPVVTAAAPAAQASATNQHHAPSIMISGTNNDISAALQSLGANTNFIDSIRKQFLDGAGPAANNKYNEMVAGLMSGKIDMGSLRAEAKTAADQIRELKKQGGDVGDTMDTYLAILDSFLKESASTPPTPVTATNRPSSIVIGH